MLDFFKKGKRRIFSILNSPSSRERSYDCSTRFYAYGDSVIEEKQFVFSTTTKFGKKLRDKKTPKDGERQIAFRRKCFTSK